MRIGLVGVDASHADHAVREFNIEQVFGPARVVAVCGTDPSRAGELAGAGAVPVVAGEPAALLRHVDAVIVGDRDGRAHRRNALPFLRAGLPVLVNKPLATRVEDAVEMLDTAERHGAALTSFSALRWAGGIEEIRAAVAAAEPPHVLLATGPADAASPHGGLSFYAVHMVEAALAVLSGPVDRIGTVNAFGGPDTPGAGGAVVATTTVGVTRVVFTFVRPTPAEVVPYLLQFVSPQGVTGGELTLGEHYLRPVFAAFVAMATSGRPPLSRDQLLAPVRILAGIQDALPLQPRP